MTATFRGMGLDRLSAELELPVEPALAARVRPLLLRAPTDAVEAAEAVAVAAELRLLADAADGHPEELRAAALAIRRAAAVVLLRSGDDGEGVRLLLEVHAGLLADGPGGDTPPSAQAELALWCLATVAVAHHEAGRVREAAAAVATVRDEARRAHEDGTIGAEVLVELETAILFGASDPLRARGSVRALERSAVGLLGPASSAAFVVRDLHGELMAAVGERRAATRQYEALSADLVRERGPRHQLALRARSSHAFARSNEGGRALAEAVRLYRDVAADAEAAHAEDPGAVPADLLAAIRSTWLGLLVETGGYAEAEPLLDRALAAARAAAADPGGAASQRVAGGGMLGREAALARLLHLQHGLLVDTDRFAEAAPVAAELHRLLERLGPIPGVTPSRALFLAVRTHEHAGLVEEGLGLLRDALDERSDRHGPGSEPYAAALAIMGYVTLRRGGPEAAAALAGAMLGLLGGAPEPDAAPHVAYLEALRDGRPVGVEDLRIDG